jgi:hypothetical protein
MDGMVNPTNIILVVMNILVEKTSSTSCSHGETHVLKVLKGFPSLSHWLMKQEGRAAAQNISIRGLLQDVTGIHEPKHSPIHS